MTFKFYPAPGSTPIIEDGKVVGYLWAPEEPQTDPLEDLGPEWVDMGFIER